MQSAIERIAIFGTGLIGASVGLALRAQGFRGSIVGWDRSREEANIAWKRGAIDAVIDDPLLSAEQVDCIILATPVFGIVEWIDRLGPILRDDQLVTDVGSTKRTICEHAGTSFESGGAYFLAGHPMAGKEVYGAAHADANLFRGAVWLFTPCASPEQAVTGRGAEKSREWRDWVLRFGCRTLDLDPTRHDEICAWASHLPQMLGTALAALLEDTFTDAVVDPQNLNNRSTQLRAIGGRAMHEMTRLGASPFSMWRDVAHTNQEAIAAAILALEQRLAVLREHLKQPELREEFERANRFRSRF
ncbi:MAG TPA: prephenate dehydrogenase [Acidobacteriaceae bacterium]|nr:prephenate dehydrogenase [Acidobacteriaceae bacterium]